MLVVAGDAGTTGSVLGIGTGAVALGMSNTVANQSVSLLTSGAFTIGRDLFVAGASPSAATATVGSNSSTNKTVVFRRCRRQSISFRRWP